MVFLLVFGMVAIWQPKLSLRYPFVFADVHLKTGKRSLSAAGLLSFLGAYIGLFLGH